MKLNSLNKSNFFRISNYIITHKVAPLHYTFHPSTAFGFHLYRNLKLNNFVCRSPNSTVMYLKKLPFCTTIHILTLIKYLPATHEKVFAAIQTT